MGLSKEVDLFAQLITSVFVFGQQFFWSSPKTLRDLFFDFL